MYRIDDPSNIASRPAASALGTEGWFLRGVAGGAQGTIVTAEHKNMVQAEMEAIRALNPTDPGSDKTDDSQLAIAISQLVNARLGNSCKGFHTVWDDGDKITTGPGRATSQLAAPSYIDVAGFEQKDITVAWSQGGIGGAPASLPALVDGQWLPFFVGWDDASTPLVTHGWDIEANADSAALLVADTGYAHWRRIGWHKIGENSSSVLTNIQRYLQSAADPRKWAWDLEEGTGASQSKYSGYPVEGTALLQIQFRTYPVGVNHCPQKCVADHLLQANISGVGVPTGDLLNIAVFDDASWPAPLFTYGGEIWRPLLQHIGHGQVGEIHYRFASLEVAYGSNPGLLIQADQGYASDAKLDIFTKGWTDTRGIHA